MNQSVLQQKLGALAAFSGGEADNVEKLGRILESLDRWGLYRINPLRFAAEHGFEPVAAIDLFVRGAKIGLFDLEWNMICPLCGGVEHNYTTIDQIDPDRFHCTFCNQDVDSRLDQQVEAAFSLNKGVAAPALDPYAGFADYWRYYFSDNFAWAPAVNDYMDREVIRSFTGVGPSGAASVRFDAKPGDLFRLVSVERHAALEMRFDAAAGAAPIVVDADLLASGFSPKAVSLPAGEVTVRVRSHLSLPAGLLLQFCDHARIEKLISGNRSSMAPFLTGKMLINNQMFRELFRAQHLPYNLKLKVGNVTILFTDLKGSTELYDNTGDMAAYNLVQEHFELLKASAHEHSGALVKTMGDAIMASFSSPLDSLKAAVGMMTGIDAMKARYRKAGHRFGLKIGMHEGPVLAVNANDTLDYFGQTVNIAARVQGLADEGEIWLTEQAYEAGGVKELMAAAGRRVEKRTAVLKGVRGNATVFKCRVSGETP
ncbi:MAG TPA: DUF5939 domain-containing protein [bacterium]|nr:DUF5939 domain-containing protein [bacterium]